MCVGRTASSWLGRRNRVEGKDEDFDCGGDGAVDRRTVEEFGCAGVS